MSGMFNESWGVDVPISTPRMMTALVEEALSVGTLVPIFRFNNSHNGIIFYSPFPLIPQFWAGTRAKLSGPTGVLLTAVMQDGTALAPHLVASLRASDQLLFLFPEQNEEAIAQVGKLLTVTDAADSASAVGGVGSVGVGGTDASETGVEELPVSATQQEPTQVRAPRRIAAHPTESGSSQPGHVSSQVEEVFSQLDGA
ncbi:hypothetical protein [Mobiluncus curtisii]|uniref:Uncharacterized protein n=1 Tax=Mobiluncus curtisii TaxID=2051 RepID=A0A2X3C1Z4_9ACTO|nr:hypothetical protein [Mobiluncus curtisii]SQC02295.1 Uncharacterised protein [Mobiluncus curtisii]